MILKKDRGDGYVSLRSFLLDFLFPHFSRYGGYPFRELRHKFLMAQGSGAAELTAACLPEGFEMIGLPGISLTWWASGRRMMWCTWRTASPDGRRWINTRLDLSLAYRWATQARWKVGICHKTHGDAAPNSPGSIPVRCQFFDRF